MLPHKGNQVWLNGSFDVLHSGHIKLFRIARILAGSNGTVFVGTDTDERISSHKGPSRPINSLQDRVLMLSSIKYIDHVLPFASNTSIDLMSVPYAAEIKTFPSIEIVGQAFTSSLEE